jgi:propionyl-CoA carboxylase alpha chain
MMFNKILIANRGEIACRVIKTAKKLGIKTVAVYSDADKDALHVEMADEAVNIGPAPSRESYLSMDAMLNACQQTGAQAVHPGYGFLSENETFAKRVEEAGIVFIGPKHASIAAMGDKIASKKLAAAANVNTIPGYNDVIQSSEHAVQVAQGIGYPVMIKASAGGGGKGLRVAFDDKEAHEGFASCRNEAKASFGDDRIFIEKFVESPRHIEIQVIGDAHGHVVFLWERECSIQRRHQKVIEEAPSPFISEATRQAMGAQAVALAKAVNYQSAGTVEFVVGADQQFYFLEMNTRLQVEHPVTECITGVDLVELMIRVAAGEKLPFTQAQVPRNGWAIECRINAEDPSRGFLPSTGRLVRYVPPPTTLEAAQPMSTRGGVRVDTGVYEGGEIPMHYDSMIAKLIVHGTDRAQAIERMRTALDRFVVRGVASNLAFQSALLAHPDFAAGRFDTGFIAKHFAQGYAGTHRAPAAGDTAGAQAVALAVALAAFVRRKARARAASISGQLPGRGAKQASDLVVITLAADGQHQHHPVRIERFDEATGQARIVADGRAFDLESTTPLGHILMAVSVNGEAIAVQVEHGAASRPLVIRITVAGVTTDTLVMAPHAAALFKHMPHKAPPDTSKLLLSPMPGLLSDVLVKPGQAVSAGERLAVIEAMKMENTLTAVRDGTVKALLAEKGSSLSVDQPILSFQ